MSTPPSVAAPRSAAAILLLSFARYWRMALIRNELTASFNPAIFFFDGDFCEDILVGDGGPSFRIAIDPLRDMCTLVRGELPLGGV